MLKTKYTGLLFSLPALLLLLLIYVIPILSLLVFSLTDYQMGSLSIQFIGLDNFRGVFDDIVFIRALKNTSLYAVLVIPFSVFLALGVALLVYTTKKSRAFWEAAYFLPVTATLVAMATVWKFMFHPSFGPINNIMRSLNIESIAFLSDPNFIIPTLSVIGIWQLLGFNMVLFISGLTAIPQYLNEAIKLDGAKNPLDRFHAVTWPMLSPTTMFILITTTITALKVFETVAVISHGADGTETLLYALYLEGFEYSNTGYGASIALIFLAIMLVFSTIQTRYLDRKVHY